MASLDASSLLNFLSVLPLLAMRSSVIQGANVCCFPVFLQRLSLLKETVWTFTREECATVP